MATLIVVLNVGTVVFPFVMMALGTALDKYQNRRRLHDRHQSRVSAENSYEEPMRSAKKWTNSVLPAELQASTTSTSQHPKFEETQLQGPKCVGAGVYEANTDSSVISGNVSCGVPVEVSHTRTEPFLADDTRGKDSREVNEQVSDVNPCEGQLQCDALYIYEENLAHALAPGELYNLLQY